ncbi:MAG: hypothetical protein CVU03_11580 [Bacteroidetes bacterium HGW-Bacteroidetes-2]|jgi:hypothetical protein|nr:MAG: hypothetical protein CVU03_11580 [Bacteroidetes bacterium HGW-Bacteroidetes-2]
MKYTRLTKEQLDALQPEFINFLASQTITAEEWKKIKKEQPHIAEDELDVFSDLVWEGALTKATYLENISKSQLYLFHLDIEAMHVFLIKIKNEEVDLLTKEGFYWLEKNITDDDKIDILTASKEYSGDKNLDKFQLIQQGAFISKGEKYKSIKKLFS